MDGGSGRLSNGGFTRVELMAVTVLLVLGAGMLMPALANAARQGRVAQCMNNARQLAFAAQLYAEDNNELWPANGTSDQSVNFENPPPNYVPRVWMEGREFSNLTSPKVAEGMMKVSLLGKYVADKKVFRCPEDRPLVRAGGASFPRPRSYGLNLFFGWKPDRITGATWFGEPNARSEVFLKVGDTVKPGELFLFGEIHPYSVCQPPFGVHPRWDAAGNPTGQNVSFHVPANHHGRTSVFSMADGHSEVRRWVNAQFNNPSSNGRPLPESDPFWHTHETPLPGVNNAEVSADFKWFSAHATVPKQL